MNNIKTAIDLLEDIMTGKGTVFEVPLALSEAAALAIHILEESIWIPMETGHRPDIGKHVLVTLWDETVMEGFWTGAVWVAGARHDADVTAWRPMPVPYRLAKEGGTISEKSIEISRKQMAHS